MPTGHHRPVQRVDLEEVRRTRVPIDVTSTQVDHLTERLPAVIVAQHPLEGPFSLHAANGQIAAQTRPIRVVHDLRGDTEGYRESVQTVRSGVTDLEVTPEEWLAEGDKVATR